MNRPAYVSQSVRLQGFSAEQLLEVVRGARFEHYVLSRAKCDAQLRRWSLDDFTVDVGRYSFAVRVVGSFPKKRLCFGYMRTLSAPTWVNGLTADESTVEFYPDGAELNYRAAPHGEWVAIEFEERSLQAAARAHLGHEVELPWNHVISFQIPRMDRLALDRLVNRLWRHPISGARMITPILGAVAEILHAWQRRSFASTTSRSQHLHLLLKRSDEYLRSNLAHPFQLGALADASGTTVRTLQRMFHTAYGVTPQEWARCFALHGVRQHLQSPTVRAHSVQGIAYQYGFRHMGRFSHYYHQLFGESPSITLANTVAQKEG